MPLELWILLAVIVAGVIGAIILKVKRRRAREAAAQSGSEGSVYPLW